MPSFPRFEFRSLADESETIIVSSPTSFQSRFCESYDVFDVYRGTFICLIDCSLDVNNSAQTGTFSEKVKISAS